MIDVRPSRWALLAAFWLFERANLDAVVLEVGLGGRLDAVNLIDSDVAVVTSIGIDHADWLGDTRESVASRRPVSSALASLPCVATWSRRHRSWSRLANWVRRWSFAAAISTWRWARATGTGVAAPLRVKR